VVARFDDLHALWVADVNGSDPANVSGQITANGDVDPVIAWTRDGSRIVFRGDIEIDELVALYSVDPVTRERRRISGALLASSGVEDFAISPDGTRAAFLGYAGVVDARELMTATLDGGTKLTVSPFLPFGANVAAFDWSPQGDALAYLSDQILVGKTELFRTDPTTPGGQTLRLSGNMRSDADVQNARWSPLSWDDTLGR
jgi:Tol biopolymer transport system component